MDKYTNDDFRRMKIIADNLAYVADALKTLDEIMHLPDCNECGKKWECKYVPDWGSPVRFNCPLFELPKEAKPDEAQDD